MAPAGGRLYRTGDLGRIDANGEIVYLGRADDEVKIRGHRVDLGEIENVLLEDAEVESAVAALVPVAGSDQLVSYVTRRDGAAAPEDALLARLQTQVKRRLPDYMVPAYLEVLDALPTMPSGKVDRAKLPKPTGRRMLGGDGAVVAADGDTEVRLRAVWAEVLGLEPAELSVTADFFTDLGGHSLLAATAVSLMRERGVGRSPAVRDLYGHPTVRGLAAHLDTRAGASVTGADAPAPRSAPQRHGSGRYGLAGVVQGGFLYLLMLMLTLPVAAIYSFNDGEVSIGVLGQLTMAATAVYLGVRWALAPLMVRLLSTNVQPGRYRLWGRVYVQLWAMRPGARARPVAGAERVTPAPGVPADARSPRRAATATSGRPRSRCPPWCASATARASATACTCGRGSSRTAMSSSRRWWSATARSSARARCSNPARGSATARCWASSRRLVVVRSSAPASGGPVRRPRPATGSTRCCGRWRPHRGSRGGPGRSAPGSSAAWRCWSSSPSLMLAPSVSLVWWALLRDQPGRRSDRGRAGRARVRGDRLRGGRRSASAVVLRRTPVGVHPARSALGIRKWIADKLLETSLTVTNSLYATLYTVAVAADARGQGRAAAPRSPPASHLDPDLLILGAGELRRRHGRRRQPRPSHNGYVAFWPTGGRVAGVRRQRRAGAGRHAARRRLPGRRADRAARRTASRTGTSWLGSPAINLPARQCSGDFAEKLTYRPPRWRLR